MADGRANSDRLDGQVASTSRRARRRSLGAMALEPRLMYDAAAGAAVATTVLDPTHPTGGEILFTIAGSGAASRVEQIGVNGSSPATNPTDVVDGNQSVGTSGNLSGIVVDAARGKYFVAEEVVTPDGTNAYAEIFQGNLATGALDPNPIYVGPPLLDSTGTQFINGYISGLQLDAANGEIYFAQGVRDPATGNNDPTQTGIFKISEDGSGLAQVVSLPNTALDAPQNIALDLRDNLVFFTDNSGRGAANSDTLGIANLSTGATTFVSAADLAAVGVTNSTGLLSGIAVDPTNDMLYFTSTDTSHQDHNYIFKASFTVTGSGATASATLGTIQQLYNVGSSGAPASIVLDVPDGLFYVANKTDKPDSGTTVSGSIEVGSLDGTQPLTTVFEASSLGLSGAARPVNLAFESTPTLTAGDSATFIIGGAPVVADGGLTATDTSGQDLAGATVKITSGFFAGDTLAADTNGTNITASYDGNGTLTLSGVDTPANYQRVLETVAFSSSNADPTNGGADMQRGLTWTVTDGNLASNAATSTVIMHAPPTLDAGAGATATFLGGSGPVTLDGTLTISDVDPNATLSGATVTIEGAISGDALNFTAANGIAGTYDAATGTLSLAGTASVASYQAALDSVTYSFNPSNADPTAGSGNVVRTVSWSVSDGVANSNPATSTLDSVHVAPTVVPDAAATFTGGGPAVTLDGGMTVSDSDSSDTLLSATVAIQGAIAGDTLNFANTGTITGSYDATTGVLTLSGAASVADYQAALNSVTYSFATGGDPTGGGSHTARSISWSVFDGVANSNVATTSLETVHAPPSISAGGTVTFTGGGAPVTLDNQVAVSDPDSSDTLVSATVTISSGFLKGDSLSAVTTGTGITASYDANAGVLTLTGQDTLQHYQSVLASVTYSFTPGGDPTLGGHNVRTIGWSVNDGVANSGSATSTVSTVNAVHVPPTVSGAGNTVLYSKQGPAVPVDSMLTLSDPDSGNMLSGATVSISSGFLAGDTLAAVTTGTGITASYNANTGVLTLSGADTLEHYQSVLESVTYSSIDHNPSLGNKDTTRTITWVVNDGAQSKNLSTPVTSTIDLKPGQSTVHAPAPAAAPSGRAWTGALPDQHSDNTMVTYLGPLPSAYSDDRDGPGWTAEPRRGEGSDHAAVDWRHAVVASDAELLAVHRGRSDDQRHGESSKAPVGKPGLLTQLKAAGRHGLGHERHAMINDLHKRAATR